MASSLRPKHRSLIPSSFVIRALARAGRRYHCRCCGERMFVRFESGLCPLCFNGRSGLEPPEEPLRPVPGHMALAGVLDDPQVEADTCS